MAAELLLARSRRTHIIFEPRERFPEKLYKVSNDDFLIKWGEDGKSISVDEDSFTGEVMGSYPGFVQIPSFANLKRLFREYNFDWEVTGPGAMNFFHPCFVRGRQDLLGNIKTKRKSVGSSARSPLRRRPRRGSRVFRLSGGGDCKVKPSAAVPAEVRIDSDSKVAADRAEGKPDLNHIMMEFYQNEIVSADCPTGLVPNSCAAPVGVPYPNSYTPYFHNPGYRFGGPYFCGPGQHRPPVYHELPTASGLVQYPYQNPPDSFIRPVAYTVVTDNKDWVFKDFYSL